MHRWVMLLASVVPAVLPPRLLELLRRALAHLHLLHQGLVGPVQLVVWDVRRNVHEAPQELRRVPGGVADVGTLLCAVLVPCLFELLGVPLAPLDLRNQQLCLVEADLDIGRVALRIGLCYEFPELRDLASSRVALAATPLLTKL